MRNNARGMAAAIDRSAALRRALRELRARPSSSRTVGQPNDLARQAQVARHPAHDDELLVVLLPEVDAGRPHGAEEDRDDGGDAAEWAGPELALPPLRRPLHLDGRPEPRGVDRLGVGRVDQVRAGGDGERRVALEIAGVTGKIGRVGELDGVDEDADDGAHVLRGRAADQREVPFVEGAHGRHEPRRQVAQRGPKHLRAGDEPRIAHGASSSSATAARNPAATSGVIA